MTDIVVRLRQGFKASKLNDWDFERTENDMMEGADLIEQQQLVLNEFINAMNILSTRVGITVKDVADIMNPIYDNARTVLKDR